MYQTVDGQTAIEVVLSNETVWLTIDKMADLFQRNKSTISRHIKNILECGELSADSVVAFFATTARDSKVYNVQYFNLDMIISVGYRVNSLRGVQLVSLFCLNDRRHLISTIQVPTVCISVQFAIFSEASVRKHPVLSTEAYYFATSRSQ